MQTRSLGSGLDDRAEGLDMELNRRPDVGKGRHPAAPNYGDCLTYAVAELSGEALLTTGGDFTGTDLVVVAL